jgi:hypothetical protein
MGCALQAVGGMLTVAEMVTAGDSGYATPWTPFAYANDVDAVLLLIGVVVHSAIMGSIPARPKRTTLPNRPRETVTRICANRLGWA